jgi:hypothetical protein
MIYVKIEPSHSNIKMILKINKLLKIIYNLTIYLDN